jgi:hypothetical protein
MTHEPFAGPATAFDTAAELYERAGRSRRRRRQPIRSARDTMIPSGPRT